MAWSEEGDDPDPAAKDIKNSIDAAIHLHMGLLLKDKEDEQDNSSGQMERMLTKLQNSVSIPDVMDIVEKHRQPAGITRKFDCHSLYHNCVTYKAGNGIYTA